MKNIQGVKIGNIVNLSIDGKLHKKNCGSPAEADELFRVVLNAKNFPTDENIKAIRMLMNERLRIALMAGIETDVETGEAFLAGFNTPIPDTLLEVIKEYNENGYPMDAIINFWKLLMINPDTRVRKSLFDFIKTHDFVLTDKGYMVVYKAVYRKSDVNNFDASFEEFVSNKYLHVKKTWKENPNKYVVYLNSDETLAITKYENTLKWDDDTKIFGKLGELYSKVVIAENGYGANKGVVFTDMHTSSMKIQLGVPCKQARKECNADPSIDCSNGLHVGATKYVENFTNRDSVVLVCLVNPANVVAVPKYDHSKMRVDEYFPFAVATYIDGKIDIVEQAYFEDDYCTFEMGELEKQIGKVIANELPIEKALNAENESRPMSELLKILENRIFDFIE